MVGPCRVRMARSNLGQSWLKLVKPPRNLGNVLEVFLMWVSVGFDWFGPGCLVLCVDTREIPGGKNRVMTVALSLFGISWHKERRTKNK